MLWLVLKLDFNRLNNNFVVDRVLKDSLGRFLVMRVSVSQLNFHLSKRLVDVPLQMNCFERNELPSNFVEFLGQADSDVFRSLLDVNIL